MYQLKFRVLSIIVDSLAMWPANSATLTYITICTIILPPGDALSNNGNTVNAGDTDFAGLIKSTLRLEYDITDLLFRKLDCIIHNFFV